MRKHLGLLVAAMSTVFGLAGIYWAVTGKAFPFGVGDPLMVNAGDLAIDFSLLGESTPEVAGPFIAVAGFLGAAIALLMATGTRRARPVLITAGWIYAVGLTMVIQDYRPLAVVAYTPIITVSKTLFDWPKDVGWAQLFNWPAMNLLVLLLTGIAFALATLTYQKRTRDEARANGSRLARFAKPAVVLAMVVPLIYSTTRWIWALGWGVGLDPEFYRQGKEIGLWIAGASLASLGAGGAILTLGLIRPWGERFPRWMPGLAGKRVPINLAYVPANIVAVLVTSAGSTYIRIAFLQGTDGKWVTNMPETLWPLWGLGLFVAATAYRRRRLAAEAEAA